MSNTNINQKQSPKGLEGLEGLEGQEDQEDPGYVIVNRAAFDPPPSDAQSALATVATSLLSTVTRAKAALTPNVDPQVFRVAAGIGLSALRDELMSCSTRAIAALRQNVDTQVVAVAARNGLLSAFRDEIVSCSTSASQFLQGTVATPENLDAVRGAIVGSAKVMKTTAYHFGSALSSSASAIKHHFLPIRQDFDASSRVVDIDGIRFVQIRPNILWVRFDNGTVCGYQFPVVNLGLIEMFLLTPAICLFLLHTTDGGVFASVYTTYTTQYGRDITCLNRITQLGKDHNFDRFETSDVCIHGTVGLTVIYKDRSRRFFHVERDGAIHQILLICD